MRVGWLALGVVVAAAGCRQVIGIGAVDETGEGGVGGGGGGGVGVGGGGGVGVGGGGVGGNVAGGGSGGMRCSVGKAGPSLVLVAAGSAAICIDQTEVTRGQYEAFRVAVHDGAVTYGGLGLPAECSGIWANDGSHHERACCPGNSPCIDAVAGEENRPAACIDWCRAAAYCHVAGKRLCGDIDGAPGSFTDFASPQKDAWTFVCTRGDDLRTYPYGTGYVFGACNDQNITKTGACDQDPAPCQTDVASLTQCQTPDGVFDLTGNVAEWEDACEAGPQGRCRTRGGSFVSNDNTEETCLYGAPNSMRGDSWPHVGFRCCDDPIH